MYTESSGSPSYHGIHKDNYYLYLKEMEFRFNNRNTDVFKKMFAIIYT